MAKKSDKPNVDKEVKPAENVVFVVANTGKGPIHRYTESRFKKFEANMKKSGFRRASHAELVAKGFELEEVVEEKPVEEIIPEAIPIVDHQDN